MNQKSRKHLSATGLLNQVHKIFKQAPDPRPKENSNRSISLHDCLMSGLAVFSLKYPSLLQYEENRSSKAIRHNLERLYHIMQPPSDTYLRERLDEVDPKHLRKPYKAIFGELQRGKILELYRYLDGFLLSVDGTGHFLSEKVHCENCCKKEHKDGRVTYYHQMLGAAIVHPDLKPVIPLCPEAITKQDGTTKNDCERNAAKRLLADTRREHPHLPFIVVEDALSSNGPHILELKRLDMRFILGVKPGDHAYLFDWVNALKQVREFEHPDRDTAHIIHKYRFVNHVPLNETQEDLKVNFLEYWEIHADGRKLHFSWVTDIAISEKNIYAIMRGGRARWKIENETFNTLKNQGYNFEHNYGHGNQHLCTVFSLLMVLAFLIDQVQFLGCTLFKKAKEVRRAWSILWMKLRSLFDEFLINSWDDVWRRIAMRDPEPMVLFFDSS